MDHYTPPPNLPSVEPSTVEVAPPVAQNRNPLLDHLPPVPPHVERMQSRTMHEFATGRRRFFFIDKLHSGQWRAVVKNSHGRVTAWRDFGTTSEDYLRAWEWAHEWVGS